MRNLRAWKAICLLILTTSLLGACGRATQNQGDAWEGASAPPGSDIMAPPDSADEGLLGAAPGDPSSQPDAGQSPGQNPGSGNPSGNLGVKRLTLADDAVLRTLLKGVLETHVTLAKGAIIEIPADYEIVSLNYRKADGAVVWSSTGFIGDVQIVSVSSVQQGQISGEKLAALNQADGGLYVSASVVGTLEGEDGNFSVVQRAEPGEGFNQYYEASGKPKFNYAAKLTGRFGDKVNQGVDPAKLTPEEIVKWRRIYAELKRVADRTVETPRALLMIDKALADKHSIAYEKTGVVPTSGAWTIAVQSTSVRHGFGNVPCAEFMSEVIRQAYQRAGYSVHDDFNAQKKNRLIWSDSAAVVNLSKALFIAGWVPWNTALYKPPTGAILMNAWGNTPGHAYISAGDDGRLIVDNGSPQGRDLRKTSQKIINMMYMTGLFFLPPGVSPERWDAPIRPVR